MGISDDGQVAPAQSKHSMSALNQHENRRDDAFGGGVDVCGSLHHALDRRPCRTSPLSGEQYTQELVNCGNEKRTQENLRMERSVLLKLCPILNVGEALRPQRS
jgi:hypothetical protein